jgi:hypothetical protein
MNYLILNLVIFNEVVSEIIYDLLQLARPPTLRLRAPLATSTLTPPTETHRATPSRSKAFHPFWPQPSRSTSRRFGSPNKAVVIRDNVAFRFFPNQRRARNLPTFLFCQLALSGNPVFFFLSFLLSSSLTSDPCRGHLRHLPALAPLISPL